MFDVSPYSGLPRGAVGCVDRFVLTLYHANAMIPIIATPPTTEPPTIPPRGSEEDEDGGAGDEDEVVVGTIEELVV